MARFHRDYYNPKSFGMRRLSCGMNATRNNTTIIAANMGRSGLMTLSIFVPATLHPMKRTDPTGGVQSPTQRFKTIMIPK